MWFTRYGTTYEAAAAGERLASKVLNVNLAKGTACFQYEARCGRCGGAGGAEAWKHTGWTCYECGGSGRGGVKSVHLYTAERLAVLVEADRKRREKKQAKEAAVETARKLEADRRYRMFAAENAELLAWWSEAAKTDEFLADVLDKSVLNCGPTDGQLAAVKTKKAKLEVRALTPDAPAGRVVMAGNIKKIEWRENSFGGGLKMLVEATEGWRVWCSVPNGLRNALGEVTACPSQYDYQLFIGCTVTFKVTLEPSDNDPKFCFGKVPKLVSASWPLKGNAA